MKKPWEPVKVKVLLGYFCLVCIASFTVWVIYYEIIRSSEDKTEISALNNRILFINSVLANLYQAEVLERTYSQTGNPADYRSYEQLMDTLHVQFETLSKPSDNLLMFFRIDSLSNLLESKRRNLKELIAIKRMGSSDDLYDRAMNRLTYSKDSIEYFMNIYKTAVDSRESTYVRQKKRKFIERILYAFSPQDNPDSALQVSISQSVQIDSIVSEFNIADSVAQYLDEIMQEIRAESKIIEKQLAEKESEVLSNDRRLTLQLRQMLSVFENDAIVNSFYELRDWQSRIRLTTWVIVTLGAVALLIIILFLILILKDISNSQRYRHELEQAKAYSDSLLKSKEQFMLSITHDLKSPLASVIGYARLMSEAVLKEQKDYYLENINNSAEHILTLISNLTDLIRLETGKLKFESARVNLRSLIHDIGAGFDPIALSKDLTFRIEFNDLPANDYNCDAVRLKQLLGNLISNAFKFTDKGEVFLRVSLAESSGNTDHIRFEVKDTGMGISEKDSQLIFNEFSQVTSNGTKRHEGVGLGLTITQRLVSLLKGTILLKSKPGEGSQFTVLLPLERNSTSVAEYNPINSERAKDQVSKKIILVDDDESFLNLIAETLEKNQMKVFKCNHPSQALKVLDHDTVDLIVTDIRMPAITGVDLLSYIQKKTGKYLPVIAITGQDSALIEDYKGVGFAACLTKPFLPEQLIENIHRILLRKSMNVWHYNKNISLADDPEPDTKGYSLNQIRRFAMDDPQSMNRILASFVDATYKNIILFRKYLEDKNYEPIPELAHKMISMFRQLEAFQVIRPLSGFEGMNRQQMTDDDWNERGKEVIGIVEQFMEYFCEEQHIVV